MWHFLWGPYFRNASYLEELRLLNSGSAGVRERSLVSEEGSRKRICSSEWKALN
jgi:hypothetical protein